ncbi:hypothetical protein ACFX14_020105 [Malus domestica]
MPMRKCLDAEIDLESRHTISASRHFRIGIFESSWCRTHSFLIYPLFSAFALNKWLSSPSDVDQHLLILVFGEYQDRVVSAGDYDGDSGGIADSGFSSVGMDHVRVHPRILHSSATIVGFGSF